MKHFSKAEFLHKLNEARENNKSSEPINEATIKTSFGPVSDDSLETVYDTFEKKMKKTSVVRKMFWKFLDGVVKDKFGSIKNFISDFEDNVADGTIGESVNEAKAYKLKADEFGGDTMSAPYNVKGESTWRVHSTYAIDQVSGNNNPDERDVVFFESLPMGDKIYIKIGGINNLKRTNGSTYGKNFATTKQDWEKDSKKIAQEASKFLTDNDHLKWLNKNAKSEGQKIKWALKDDYSNVIEDLVNRSLGLKESLNERAPKMKDSREFENIKQVWAAASGLTKGGSAGRYGKEFEKAKKKALQALNDMMTYAKIGV